MSGNVFISVVIPTYNHAGFVGDAVDSVLGQTYPGPFEVIVVDDGSTDETRERLARYGDRIRYVHQENRGLPGARNTGIRKATGEWIGLLDSDDMWHPQMLDVLVPIALREGVDGLCCNSVRDPRDFDSELPRTPPIRRVGVESLLSSTPLSSSGIIVRKAAFESVGYYDESLRCVEDRDMWLRLAPRFALAVAQCNGHFYRRHAGQMNRATDRMLAHFKRVLDKFFAEHPEQSPLRATGYAFMYNDAAIGYLDEGARSRAMAALVKSLWIRPWTPPGRYRWSTLTRAKIMTRLLLGDRLFRTFARPSPTNGEAR